MLKAVFFDAAGTLFEPREPVALSYARLARDYGVDADAATVGEAFRRAFRDAPPLAFGSGHCAGTLRSLERRWWRELVAQTFGGGRAFADFEGYFDTLFAYFAEPANWTVDAAAASTVQRLKGRGLRLGIISNFDFRLYRILEGLGLGGFFDSITISSEAGYAKPAPEVFQSAIARHSLYPYEALHVGDSEHHDVAGAEAAGLAAALLNPREPQRIRVAGRIARISALDAVIELTEELAFP